MSLIRYTRFIIGLYSSLIQCFCFVNRMKFKKLLPKYRDFILGGFYLSASRKWWFYIICMLAISWQLAQQPSCIRNIPVGPLPVRFMFLLTIGNAMVITLPYFILKPKWRWTLLIPVWGVAIYCFANSLYNRFFGDFLPYSTIFLWQNFGVVLLDSIIGIIESNDFIQFLVPLIVTALWAYKFRRWNKYDRFSSKAKIISIVISVLPFILWECKEIHRSSVNKDMSLAKSFEFRYFEKHSWATTPDWINGGVVQYFIRSFAFDMNKRLKSKTLTFEQNQKIAKYLSKSSKNNNNTEDSIESRTKFNYNKNLIFIVVESLNSEVVTAKINGNEVMPNLNSAISDSSAIVCLDVMSQILNGTSSDGQFMFNTGIYPSSDMIPAWSYDRNEYHSLAKILKFNSFEVICENSSMWNHESTNKCYGYDGLICNLMDVASHKNQFIDECLLDSCASIFSKIEQPFFCFATTMGMHTPYQSMSVKMPSWIKDSHLSEERKNYYNMCYAFDEVFKKFMTKLKHTGIYDNSVIVIASDHAGPLDNKGQEQPIFFAAFNTGLSMHIPRAIEQVDIFPTVLDIMGRQHTDFKGMGYSALYPRPKPASRIPSDEAQEVANLMLFGDWFSPKSIAQRKEKQSKMSY